MFGYFHPLDEIKSCISVGHELQQRGHRIRVVTHSIFQSTVMKLGLEFFSASSDPEHPIAVSLKFVILPKATVRMLRIKNRSRIRA